MLGRLVKWITPVLSQTWLLVVGVFGVLAIYAKGRNDKKKEAEIEKIQEDLEVMKRLRNVETSTDLESALKRLHEGKHLRD